MIKVVPWFFTPESPRWLFARGRHAQATALVRSTTCPSFGLSCLLSLILVRSTPCLSFGLRLVLSCLKNSTNNNDFNTERVDELMINCCLWTRWGTTQPQTITTSPRVWAQLCYSIDLRFNIQHSSLDKEIANKSNKKNQTPSLQSI